MLAPFFSHFIGLLENFLAQKSESDFLHLSQTRQEEIVNQLAHGQLPLPGFPQVAFFKLLHRLSLEGFLGDPKHGGNYSELGWRYIGFLTPHLRQKKVFK